MCERECLLKDRVDRLVYVYVRMCVCVCLKYRVDRLCVCECVCFKAGVCRDSLCACVYACVYAYSIDGGGVGVGIKVSE